MRVIEIGDELNAMENNEQNPSHAEYGTMATEEMEILVQQLRKEVEEIQTRNKLKDLDKAFETSFTRMFAVMITTYGVLLAYFTAMNIEHAELNAIVPALGFYLSTWSMSVVKWIWLKVFPNATRK